MACSLPGKLAEPRNGAARPKFYASRKGMPPEARAPSRHVHRKKLPSTKLKNQRRFTRTSTTCEKMIRDRPLNYKTTVIQTYRKASAVEARIGYSERTQRKWKKNAYAGDPWREEPIAHGPASHFATFFFCSSVFFFATALSACWSFTRSFFVHLGDPY